MSDVATAENGVEREEGEGRSGRDRVVFVTHPEAGIVELAEEIEADLVLVGSRGLNPMVAPPIGSVSKSIATHAHCPVMVVRREKSADGGREERTIGEAVAR